MKIKIEISEKDCNTLLMENHYVTEDTRAHFYASIDPYNDDADINDLRSIEFKVAYPMHNRPEELDKEHPMLEVLEQYDYEKVVNKLFNKRLMEKLFD